MSEQKGTKNKLFKGLTDYDILVWEEEKMRHQRKAGRKITDVEFLRYLLMASSRPVISAKDGVAGGFLTGQGPIYEKADTLLERYRTQSQPKPTESDRVPGGPGRGVDRDKPRMADEFVNRTSISRSVIAPDVSQRNCEGNAEQPTLVRVRSQALTRD
ncbi:MAG: hypothetical protein C4K49_01265 [Candidatus Thorarchaeota archaeon]|nr:MAG: hypothetical protein C4K49_01265 [Candidatus Thorarchaeota archaeon]